MRTLAILPIKSFGAAKQRLSGLLGGGSREALAQAPFRLRDHLVSDDQHIAGLRRGGLGEHSGQVVARADLGQPAHDVQAKCSPPQLPSRSDGQDRA